MRRSVLLLIALLALLAPPVLAQESLPPWATVDNNGQITFNPNGLTPTGAIMLPPPPGYASVQIDQGNGKQFCVGRPTFPSYLASARPEEETGSLAPTTLKKIIQTTKRFFTWLKTTYPSEFRGVSAAWIDTLWPPRSIQPAEDHEFISLEEIQRIAALQIDPSDLALRRDQTAAVMLFLSGMRARAFSTLPICAVDLSNRTIK